MKNKKVKEIKPDYTYYFADGSNSVVTAQDVGQEWINILHDMDEEDRKKQYNYSRRNYPLSQVDYEGETFVDPNAVPLAKWMRHLQHYPKVNVSSLKVSILKARK